MGANRVLLVAAERARLRRLGLILSEAGYEVTAFDELEPATAALSEGCHDVLVGDASPPAGLGRELCRVARADSLLSAMPVVLLVTPSLDEVLQALEAGASSVIAEHSYADALLFSLQRIQGSLDRQGSNFATFGVEIFANSRRYHLNPPGIETIDLLLSTYDDALQQGLRLDVANREVTKTMTRLTTLEESYRQLLDTNMDAVVVVDEAGLVRYANPSARSMAPAMFREGAVFEVGMQAGVRSELELYDELGNLLVAEMRVVRTVWEGADAKLAVLRDATEQVGLREQLKHLAIHDELTGLLNRRGFMQVGEQQLLLARRLGSPVCLAYLDLDGLKQINDELGHAAGDQALLDVSGLALACFREADIVARIGGDEFAILCLMTGEFDPQPMVQRLRDAMATQNLEGRAPYSLSASIGVAVHTPQSTGTLDNLMSAADSRMYEEKLGRRADPTCALMATADRSVAG